MALFSGDRIRGTLDVLILKALTWGPRHGYAVARWLEDSTADALSIEEGSLYPALYRMEERGWIASEWGRSDLGRRVRLYHMTATGRRELRAEHAEWRRYVRVVGKVLEAKA